MVWIWQHNKGTDDYKITLNCVRKFMKNKSEKEAEKGPSFKKLTLVVVHLHYGKIRAELSVFLNKIFFLVSKTH